MSRIFLLAAALCAAAARLICHAQIESPFVEAFETDPTARQWGQFGDGELIRWNSAEENAAVTWDSSRPNSYLRIPLPAVMTRRDDFSAELDLLLRSYAAGVNPLKAATFQLAFGFQNYANAAAPTFMRAAANAAPNLVEFNFMPDAGFGPTIWPAVMSTNGAMNYNGPSDFSVFDLPLDVTMRIVLAYTSSNETATITIRTNGTLVGPVTSARLATNDVGFGRRFTQFKVDAFAIASYSDAGQSGPFAGSILAEGAIDNVTLRFPRAPVTNLRGARTAEGFEAHFLSRTNWVYRLQATETFETWEDIGEAVDGTSEELTLRESTDRPLRFYRIHAVPAD